MYLPISLLLCALLNGLYLVNFIEGYKSKD